MSVFDVQQFWRFCNNLRIDTKERGLVTLGRTFMGSQRRLINEIAKGLENGVHEFVTLKARQLGISTASLALDLYWAGKYRGISGALVVHDEPARDQFRTTLELYYQSLPNGLKRRIRQHNRNQLVFDHGTRFQYKVAGTKTKSSGTLGRSSALTFLHATEVAFWGDPAGIDSLVATLAQENPIRFYHWETTANGYNHFSDMWKSAKESVTKKAIFIGFWANEMYAAKKDSDVYEAYWGKAGRMTPDERTMVKEVKSLYEFDITIEQLAWYRWYLKEKADGDDLQMWQEMPHTEYAAFVATGSQFFTARAIGDAYRRMQKEPAPKYFRFNLGMDFADTDLVPCHAKIAHLKIWEHPIEGAQYVLGADPAYGSSEEADRYAISVWRCYADKIEQVAEFCTTEMSTANFAWVMVYLASAYDPCTWNLEINGPGTSVLTELQNLSKSRTLGPATLRPAMQRAMKNISNYLYRKMDSLYSAPSAIHTMTTSNVKERYLGAFKDYFERGYCVPHSRDLLDEMKELRREGGSTPSASSGNHDDRAIAAGLAVIAWNDQVRSRLMMQNQTFAQIQARGTAAPSNDVGSRVVQNMMARVGFTEAIRKPAEIQGQRVGRV